MKWLSHIEGASLKFKNQKRFLFRPRCIRTGQQTGPKISSDSPFKRIISVHLDMTVSVTKVYYQNVFLDERNYVCQNHINFVPLEVHMRLWDGIVQGPLSLRPPSQYLSIKEVLKSIFCYCK